MRKSKVARRAMNRPAASHDQSPWHVVSTRPPRSASQRSANFRPRPPAGDVAAGLRRRTSAPRAGALPVVGNKDVESKRASKAKEPAFRPALSLARCLKRHYPPPDGVTRNPTALPHAACQGRPRATGGMLGGHAPHVESFRQIPRQVLLPVQPKCHTRLDIGRPRRIYLPLQDNEAALMIGFERRDAQFGTDRRWPRWR